MKVLCFFLVISFLKTYDIIGQSRHAQNVRGTPELYEQEKFHAQHLTTRLMVFINPRVASLPKHHHLFGGNGCFKEINDNRDGGSISDFYC